MLIQHLVIVFSAFHFLNLIFHLNSYYQKVINATSLSLGITIFFSALVLINPIDTEFNLLPVALTTVCFCLALFITEHHIFDLSAISRRSYFDQIADGAIITSSLGRIIHMSQNLENIILKTEKKEIVGNDILTIFPQWKEPFQKVLETKEDQTALFSFTRNEQETQYDVTLHANLDQYDHISTILFKFQDVTVYRQLIDQVNDLSIRDPLTGILNRRHFEILVLDHLKLAERYKRPGCLLKFDLDDFSHVNNFYGHHTGNKALAEFARQMSSFMRESDILARYGDDEFVLYLPETNCEGALVAIKGISKFILGTTIDLEDDVIVPLKCSAGLLPITEDTRHLSFQELIIQAEKAMYAAKRQGFNVIGVFDKNEITFHVITLDKHN